MPRITFATSALGGAAPGMSKLAVVLAGGGKNAYQDAYDKEATTQSKIGLALAQMQHARAETDLVGAKTVEQNRQNELQTPEAILKRSMLTSGVPLDAAGDVDAFLNTGRIDKYDAGGQAGPVMPTPDWAAKGNLSALAARIAADMGVLGGSAKGQEDHFKGQGQQYETEIARKLFEGTASPQAAESGFRLLKAAPLFATAGDGSTFNVTTGQVNDSGARARSVIALRGAQARQADAGTVKNTAQADSATAAAELSRARAGAVGTTGGGRIPVGYRSITDPDTGETRLEPIPGGPKDPNAQTGKPLPASAAKTLLENQTNLRRAETALALVSGKTIGAEGDPEAVKGDSKATGLKGYLPGQVLNRMDPEGIATRAAIADLGSLVIHDRSGAAVTAAEFPRLAPFIPSATDDAETAKTKLQNFVRVYREEVEQAVAFHRASGFNVPAETLQGADTGKPTPKQPADPAAPAAGAPVAVKTDADYAALPSGTVFVAPDGKRRRKP